MNGLNIINSWGMLMTGVIFVFAAFFIIALVARIISKIAIKTFFQEKEKYNGNVSSGSKKRET
jgi:Na+-transporting methylmalonyl-CoA/oxaloacetate decarboxylase gamma subunit